MSNPVRIPTKGKWNQPNKGEIFGNLYRTQGVDLKTNPGKMRVSPRLIVNTKDNDGGISNMGVPGAFAYLNNKYYAMCGVGASLADGTGKILVSASDSPSATFANDALASTPTDVNAETSDMVFWQEGNWTAGTLNASLFVSTFSSNASQIKRLYEGTTWTTNWFTSTVAGTFKTNGSCKNMCVGFNHNLYIADDDSIIYVPFPTGTSSINAVLTTSAANSNNGATNVQDGTIDFKGQYRPIWIRTTSQYLWIGLMENYFSGSGTKGYVGKWDAKGTTLNAIYDIEAPSAPSACVLGDILHVIDAYGRLKKFDGTSFKEIARLPVANQPIEMPGIYNSLTNSRWIHQRGMDVVDGRINISVNNFVSTGVYVEDMPSGIWELDDSDPQHPFLYHKSPPCADNNDWGQQLLNTAGALYGTKRSTATFLAGFSYFTDSGSTSRNAIFYDDVAHTTARRGIFVTPWFDASQTLDVFQKITYRYRDLVSGSKIIAKFRTDKSATLPFVASVTWTSTTTFTSTDSNFQYAQDGNEVEVMMGKRASTTAQISGTPVLNAGTYTVTLNDTIGFGSGSAKVKINNYKTLGTPLAALNQSSGWYSATATDNSIQIKTELRDEGGMELNDVTLTSATQQQTR